MSTFHRVKREAPTDLADPTLDEARDFLREVRERIINDPRISDARKRSLLDRIDAGIADDAPVVGSTMYAWKNLETALSELATQQGIPAPQEATVAPRRPRANTPRAPRPSTPRRPQARRVQGIDDNVNLMALISGEQPAQEGSPEAHALASDAGFKQLQNSPASNPQDPGHGIWRMNYRLASEMRDYEGATMTEFVGPVHTRINNAQDRSVQAITEYQTLSVAYRENPRSVAQVTVEEARALARRRRAEFLTIVAESHACVHPRTTSDALSEEFWTTMNSDHGVDRDELWRASEHVFNSEEARQVRMGVLSVRDMHARQITRARVRQQILDREGGHKLDPVNITFANEIRRQRSMAASH